MSRVDVVIPCYNYGRFLPASVESVLSQQGVGVRVLILDDASLDGSAAVAAGLAAQDARVEFRPHAVNRGHIATYNEGLAWATADYLLLFSADDLLTAGALGRAVALLERHPEVGLAYGRQIILQGEEQLAPVGPDAGEAGWCIRSGRDFLAAACSAGDNPVPTPTAVVRTAVQHALGDYRKELPHTGDLEMWLRFAGHGSIGIVAADQAYKRMHGTNMQIAYVSGVVKDLEQRRAAFEMFFKDYDSRVADGPAFLRQALSALAGQAFWAASRAFDQGDGRACQDLLRLATDLDAGLPGRREWARLSWKRCLGPRLWGLLRPWVERRRRPAPS